MNTVVTISYTENNSAFASVQLYLGELQILLDLIDRTPESVPRLLRRKIVLALQMATAAREADPTLGEPEEPEEDEWPSIEDLEL